MTPIQRAVALFDSQTAFAEAISTQKHTVSQSQVSHWCTDLKPVPPHHCIPIEEAVNRTVTRYDLRPDIFGSKPVQAA